MIKLTVLQQKALDDSAAQSTAVNDYLIALKASKFDEFERFRRLPFVEQVVLAGA